MAYDLAMVEHAVVIVGGGPTGLMLAGELALAGVDVAIVERRAGQELDSFRAGGLHSRSIEVLDQRGIAERFLAAGQTAQVAGFAWIRLDMSDFPTRHNYGLALSQERIERILARWIEELAVPIYRGREVTGFAQDDKNVDVELSDGVPLRAEYLVGCDGGRSLIRKAAGIDFPGWDPTTSNLIAEVEVTEEPEWGTRHDSFGIHGFSRLENSGRVRVMVTEPHLSPTGEPRLCDLSEALIAVYGTDYGIRSPTSICRFTDMARQAAAYRERRVLLAGDAAHVHNPVGGQGLNTGVQDAVNLGWKLAQVVNRTSPESLLDTYHAERHPVAARVLRNTLAQVALLRCLDDRLAALRDSVSELLSMDEPRRRFAAMMSGLDVRYDLGDGHPLLGRRMPDLDLVTARGPQRVFTLLHKARPVLLNFGEPGSIDITPWADRVASIDGSYFGTWELPALGMIAAPTAVLIRPDGYVAWVGDRARLGLTDALATWFGLPAGSNAALLDYRQMIEVLTGFPDNVVAFLGKGRITRDDYEKILIPTVERALSRNRKLRCYYELGSEYTGFEAGAAWEDFKLGMEHLTRWERAAVVTDVEWMRVATNAVGFLMPLEVRVFTNSERDQARSWITAP